MCSIALYFTPVSPYDFGARSWCVVLLFPLPVDTFTLLVRTGYLLFTLLLQTFLGVLFFHFFRRATHNIWIPVVFGAVFLLTGYPLSLVAVWLDARVVPAIYRSTEGSPIDWEESCRIDHSHLVSPAGPRYASLERSARAWLVSHSAHEPMVLQSCRCIATSYPTDGVGRKELTDSFTPSPRFDIRWDHAGIRHLLFDSHVPSYVDRSWSAEDGYQFTPTSLMFQRQYAPGGCVVFRFDARDQLSIPRSSTEGCPLLAEDGEHLARLENTTYSTTERQVVVEEDHGKPAMTVDISRIGAGFVVLEGLSIDSKRLLVSRQSSRLLNTPAPDLASKGFSHEYAEIAFNGEILWRLPVSREVDECRLIVDPPNWVRWRYCGRGSVGPCGLDWSIDGRRGAHQPGRGRSIVAVTLQPAGRHIALSVSDLHTTGAVPDAVYVIRTDDGGEVFRRQLPPLANARVQFLGNTLLACTDFDGSDGFVRVVKLPED